MGCVRQAGPRGDQLHTLRQDCKRSLISFPNLIWMGNAFKSAATWDLWGWMTWSRVAILRGWFLRPPASQRCSAGLRRSASPARPPLISKHLREDVLHLVQVDLKAVGLACRVDHQRLNVAIERAMSRVWCEVQEIYGWQMELDRETFENIQVPGWLHICCIGDQSKIYLDHLTGKLQTSQSKVPKQVATEGELTPRPIMMVVDGCSKLCFQH